MKGRFKAVDHGQQVLGKAFDAEFARLGYVFFGAAAGVLHLGLGAQVVVIELLDLGLQGLYAGGVSRLFCFNGLWGGRIAARVYGCIFGVVVHRKERKGKKKNESSIDGGCCANFKRKNVWFLLGVSGAKGAVNPVAQSADCKPEK